MIYIYYENTKLVYIYYSYFTYQLSFSSRRWMNFNKYHKNKIKNLSYQEIYYQIKTKYYLFFKYV